MLSPIISQPRYHRRAKMLLEAGYSITVYTFLSGYYEENTYPEGVEVRSLGRFQMGKYFSRIPKLLKGIFLVRKMEKEYSKKPAIVYVFGFNMAVVGALAFPKHIPLIYEVGDIQIPLPHNSLVSKVCAWVENKIMARCQKLTVTSPGFITDHYDILYPGITKKVITIENKLARVIATKFSRPTSPKEPSSPIKIGYIGAFKYENCIFPLIDAVSKSNGLFELHFYGDGPLKEKIATEVAKYANIFYHGSFASTDLQNIYETIHVSYVVYDNCDANVRMALPNKLYDGPYFGVPLIVAEDTLLAKRVRLLNIGLVIDPRCEGFADRLLNELTPQVLTRLSDSALKLELDHMVENYDQIVPMLRELGNAGSAPNRNCINK